MDVLDVLDVLDVWVVWDYSALRSASKRQMTPWICEAGGASVNELIYAGEIRLQLGRSCV